MNSRVPTTSNPARTLSVRLFRNLAGLALSLCLIAYLFRGVDLYAFAGALRSVPSWAIFLNLLIIYLTIPLRTVQWQLLLDRHPHATFPAAWRAICFGHLANALLPFRGGEAVKAVALARMTGLPAEKVLMSVIFCRIQDVLPVLLFALGAILAIKSNINGLGLLAQSTGLEIENLVHACQVLALILLAFAAGVVLLLLARLRITSLAEKFTEAFTPSKTAWVRARLTLLIEGLDILRHPGRFWGAQMIALLCWFLFALGPFPLLLAYSETLRQGLFAALIVNGLTTLVQLLPVAPSGVGTFHLACIAALHFALPGMSPETALAIAVVVHITGTFGPALIGLPYIRSAWQKGTYPMARQ